VKETLNGRIVMAIALTGHALNKMKIS